MNKLKYFLILFILFLTPNAYAVSLSSDSFSQADSFNHTSRYDYSTDNYLGDQTNFGIGTIGNTINGKSYYFQFNFHHSITANKTYDLKISSSTNDYLNNINKDRTTALCYSSFASNFNTKECDNDIAIISVTRGSLSSGYAKNFTIRFMPLVNKTYWGFKIAGGLYNLTGINNWKVTSIELTEVDTNNSQEIINNNNQNTQNIIDNSIDNTNNIINNNNQNTQNIIDNQNELLGDRCSNLLDYNNYFHNENGSSISVNGDTLVLSSNNSWAWIGYDISTEVGKTYYISGSTSSNSETALVWVGNNMNNFDNRYYFYENNGSFSGSFVASTNHTYIRLYASKSSANTSNYYRIMFSEKNKPYCAFGSYQSKLDETTNAINETNSYLMDDTNPNISDNDFMTMFNSIGFNDPLSYLLQLPTRLINKLVSAADSCSTIQLGTLLGTMISLPCINLENLLGSSLWNIIDVIFSVALLSVIFKNLYQTFANLLTMGGEKEAREKFSMPTPMEFLAKILGGDV